MINETESAGITGTPPLAPDRGRERAVLICVIVSFLAIAIIGVLMMIAPEGAENAEGDYGTLDHNVLPDRERPAGPLPTISDQASGRIATASPRSQTSSGSAVAGESTEYPCTDTDGGSDHYTRGTVTGVSRCIYDGVTTDCRDGIRSQTDKCAPVGYETEGQVFETSCGDDGRISIISFLCPNGCADGACLPVGAKNTATKAPSADPLMRPDYMTEVVQYGEMSAYAGAKDGRTFVIINRNGKDMRIAEAPVLSMNNYQGLYYDSVTFSPKGRYLTYYGGGWEGGSANIYDIAAGTTTMRYIMGEYDFSPLENYFYNCSEPGMFYSEGAVVYKVPGFKQHYRLPAEHSNGMYNSIECEPSTDGQRLMITMTDDYVEPDIERRVEFDFVTGRARDL